MWHDDNGRWQMMGDGGAGTAGLMLLLLILILVLAVGAAVYVLMRSPRLSAATPTTPGAEGPDPAAQILRERLARGEIEEQEYLSRRATLEQP